MKQRSKPRNVGIPAATRSGARRWTAGLAPVLVAALFLGCALPAASVQAAGARLELLPGANGWQGVYSRGLPEQVHRLEASTELGGWSEIAVLHDGPFLFSDPRSDSLPQRFYRLASERRTARDDHKNLVSYPGDGFRSSRSGIFDESRWIKFLVLLASPDRVWFQPSAKYPFHYDYATARIPGFEGLSHAEFDALTLQVENQQAVLGAVLFAPDDATAEYGIQFVGLDPYPPEQVAAWFDLVRSTVFSESPAQAYYLPAPEQLEVAERFEAYFADRGIQVSGADRWLVTDGCYAPGWALGRLVYVDHAEIASAYAAGTLKPTDILLTDAVPSEIPYVAGIISLSPATHNSHVAILARSYGVPFAFPSSEAERHRLRQLDGHEVMFRLDQTWGGCHARVVDLGTGLEASLRDEILELKRPPALNLAPMEPFGAIASDVTELIPADIRCFGGKAANYGLLRRRIPDNSRFAIAFSFDLWNDFMDQHLPELGRSLREEIQARLAGIAYPPDVGMLRDLLDGVRDLIRDRAVFDEGRKAEIVAALSGFDESRKIRFRSSTNVEDAEQFTGAGLYDSYSGCLADDLDGDDSGPSQCDPERATERGVFRAIQRVYASFYNENAFLERLRHGVDEAEVGMAVLAHHSFPDPDELANGVATLAYQRSETSRTYQADAVTQRGATSVANPEGGAVPERVQISKYSSNVYVSLRERSNLVPLGGYVMDWETDYRTLMQLLIRVTDGYAAMFPRKTRFTLDFEYKRISPGTLVVKQVRELPLPEAGVERVPFLLNEPTRFVVFQGEHGDIFASHRLKCLFDANTRNLRLTNKELASTLWVDSTLQFIDGNRLVTLENGAARWPGATFSMSGDQAIDRWAYGEGDQRREYALETTLIRSVDETESPLLTARDFRYALEVRYAKPVVTTHPDGSQSQVRTESVELRPLDPVNSRSLLQERRFRASGGVELTTVFYWPENPRGPTAGYTAPVQAWVETTIEGLTAEPMVLRGEYSQTYRPGHHNFWEEFIFDPKLEPGISEAQLAELAEADIDLLYVSADERRQTVYAVGTDGQLRPL